VILHSLRAARLLALVLLTLAGVRADVVFSDQTAAAGLVEPLAGLMGHGGAAGDVDGDGFPDLFVGGFADRPDAEYAPALGPVPNRLLRNLGNGRFAVVDNQAVQMFARTSGAVFADLDNNGTLELYVANNAKQQPGRGDEPQRSAKTRHSQLFRNDNGQLVDISKESGGCPETLFTARNVGVFDYDADGLLDLFIVEDKFTRAPRSLLLRNEGGLKFKDVTVQAGLPEDIFGLGLAVADVNDDGRPDFFVGHSNRLFLSAGDGQYREATEVADVFKYEPANTEDWPCGVAFGDLNRDGRFDLVVSAHANRARNRIFLNDGVRDGVLRFREITRESGLDEVVPAKCPHVEIQDFDNDGWPDLYFSAAWLESGKVTPLVYRHVGVRDGLPRFEAARRTQEPMVYYPAGPTVDYDADGRLDLFLVNWFSGNHSRLLKNESLPKRWLQVKVQGRRMNRMGIGAQVRLFAPGKLGDPAALLGFQEITTGFGYASGQPARAHFGLGENESVDLQVRLPRGQLIEQRDVKADQLVTVQEP
jgi:enediyne biosynthesis protein E4